MWATTGGLTDRSTDWDVCKWPVTFAWSKHGATVSGDENNNKNQVQYFHVPMLNSSTCIFFSFLSFYNCRPMEAFKAGCVDDCCRLIVLPWIFGPLQGISSPHMSFFFFFLLSSFNSKMAWQQLHTHGCSELRHWQEQTAVFPHFSLNHSTPCHTQAVLLFYFFWTKWAEIYKYLIWFMS